MIIPKSLTVGFTKYTIKQPDTLPYCRMGYTDYDKATISVAKRGEFIRYHPTDRHITFWHELTHAILNDMGHPLRNNEDFVIRFSTRLSKAIRTADL